MIPIMGLFLLGTAQAEDSILLSDFTGTVNPSTLEALNAQAEQLLTSALEGKSVVRQDEEQDVDANEEASKTETCADDACWSELGNSNSCQYVLIGNIDEQQDGFVFDIQLLAVESQKQIGSYVITKPSTLEIGVALSDVVESLAQDVKKYEADLLQESLNLPVWLTLLKEITGSKAVSKVEPPTEQIEDENSDTLAEQDVDGSQDSDDPELASEQDGALSGTSDAAESDWKPEEQQSIEDRAGDLLPPFNGVRVRMQSGYASVSFNQSSDGSSSKMPPSTGFTTGAFAQNVGADVLLLNIISAHYSYTLMPHATQVSQDVFKQSAALQSMNVRYRHSLINNYYLEFGLGQVKAQSSYFEYNPLRTSALINDLEIKGTSLSASFVSRGVAGLFDPLSLSMTVSETFGSSHIDSKAPLPVISMFDLGAEYEYQNVDPLAAVFLLSANASADLLHYKIAGEDEAKIRAQRLALRIGVGLQW